MKKMIFILITLAGSCFGVEPLNLKQVQKIFNLKYHEQANALASARISIEEVYDLVQSLAVLTNPQLRSELLSASLIFERVITRVETLYFKAHEVDLFFFKNRIDERTSSFMAGQPINIKSQLSVAIGLIGVMKMSEKQITELENYFDQHSKRMDQKIEVIHRACVQQLNYLPEFLLKDHSETLEYLQQTFLLSSKLRATFFTE